MSPRRKAVRAGTTGPVRKAVVRTSKPPKPKEEMIALLLAHEARRTQLRAERDDLIREGWDAGVSVDIMAACLGITPARVYQIKDGRYGMDGKR